MCRAWPQVQGCTKTPAPESLQSMGTDRQAKRLLVPGGQTDRQTHTLGTRWGVGTAGACVLVSSGRQVHLGQSRWGRGPGWGHSLGHCWVPDRASGAAPYLCTCARRPSPGQAPGPRVAGSIRSFRKQREGPVIAGPSRPRRLAPTQTSNSTPHWRHTPQGRQTKAVTHLVLLQDPPLSQQLAGTRMGPGHPEPCSELRLDQRPRPALEDAEQVAPSRPGTQTDTSTALLPDGLGSRN